MTLEDLRVYFPYTVKDGVHCFRCHRLFLSDHMAPKIINVVFLRVDI